MTENKILEDSKVEEALGGTEEKKKGCELCGETGYYESYYITLKFTDGSEYLGRKKICMKCRDTYLRDFIKKNYPGRSLKGLHMDGPLAN